jgi:predicted small secreted protein
MFKGIRRIAALLLLVGATGILAAGCKNTAKGFGKDMENTGEKIQDKMD